MFTVGIDQGPKVGLNKLQKTEMVQNMYSDHNAIKIHF